jgi:hypothetical protein
MGEPVSKAINSLRVKVVAGPAPTRYYGFFISLYLDIKYSNQD